MGFHAHSGRVRPQHTVPSGDNWEVTDPFKCKGNSRPASRITPRAHLRDPGQMCKQVWTTRGFLNLTCRQELKGSNK